MNLKFKVLVLTLINLGILIGFTYLLFYIAFFGYINTETKSQMMRNFESAEKIIDNEKGNLDVALRDWAYWDDTYNFIADGNEAYKQSNLQKESLEYLKLNLMLIANDQGEIIGSENQGLSEDVAIKVTEKIKQGNFYTGILTKEEDVNTDLVNVDGQVYFVGSALVSNSSHSAVSNGSIVFVRAYDDNLMGYIEDLTGLKVSLSETPLGTASPLGTQILPTEYNGETYLTSNKLQEDISGEKSINMVILQKQTNYSLIANRFNGFVIGFILLILLILLCDYFVLNRMVFKRLTKLKNFLNEVTKKKDTALSIRVDGPDELGQLAESANKMLEALDSANKDIKQMDERYRLVMEATSDGYIDFLVKSQEIYISPEWKTFIGYEGGDGYQLYLNYCLKIHPQCKKRLLNTLDNVVNGKIDYYEEEFRVIGISNRIIWVLQRGKVVQRDENNIAVRVISTISDITMRKTNEEEIVFLSYSDPLTMLNNRAFMKRQFEMLNNEKNPDYFIIMCDINGLKITNDAFGHKEGDRILVAVSNLLMHSCQPDDVVSRWSGDGFVMIVKDKDQKYISNLIERIMSEAKKIDGFHFNISMGVGSAKRSIEHTNTEDVMNLAEKRMFRSKLMDRSSSRNAPISSLTRTLHEKSSETEEHTMRIKVLSNTLGKKLGLLQDKLDELGLLSLLHDIGKIGIPEQILIKPEKLTEEEWGVIKTHSEIGYRIAKSTPELEHIADAILSHHEKYDGTGYPNGQKGEAIPYLSRIINVVDSFDVMTHSRIYKEASELSYAINELKRCSGTQFDPNIVKQFLVIIEADELISLLEVAI
ncbi:HD domain-containing phosphohydrolase [Acetobacterium sp.]|uniref:HD domain-containing phosphohydrolase n=1 Tax=Acetobacterium sp. TaxID=1872094 RepID=UPI002F413419